MPNILIVLTLVFLTMCSAPERIAAASERCEALIAEGKAATARLTEYTSRGDAKTSNALALTREATRALRQASEACAGTDKEAGLKFSTMSMEMRESALADATTEKLHDLGIFMLPDEP